jgi:ATP-dependent helicase HrpA
MDMRPSTTVPDPQHLSERLDGIRPADAARLRRRLGGRRRGPRNTPPAGFLDALAAAEERVTRRRAGVPRIDYPEALPISAAQEELRAAIRDHQVVIVAGETGSGKTTQLPKLCLELGRGVRGMVGHTQPRRIAARAVAERIAAELAVPLGAQVGYAVRFTDRVGEDTLVKVMTDGILLAEIQRDRDLLGYDTIIIDEAHERSLNIDFLLGYLHRLLPRRPDLKAIITSATIEVDRFSRHFGDAPVIEVSGRTYPVQLRYRPLLQEPASDDEDEDPGDSGAPTGSVDLNGPGIAGGSGTAGGSGRTGGPGGTRGRPRRPGPAPRREVPREPTEAICDAVTELAAEGPGDVLVFLSGEREIRDTEDALRRLDLPHTEILPLYARLSAAEQHRVFTPHPGRRVVLATNIAETSLTVPGIRYVVDPGTARISRYSNRLKVQRLPIEPVSQASARQRAGRCGRLEDGICIRLYSEEDYRARPAFTEPEILRTSLASVILSMTSLGLGEVADFGFLDPPDARQIRDGLALLHELGALEPDPRGGRRRLTPTGRAMAQLPVDPRLARMIVEADRLDVLPEVLVVAAALSIQDPRERPAENRAAADAAHARFADPDSDFVAYLNLWNHLTERQRELSSSKFRRLCREEYLHYLRVREWQDVHAQLRQVARSLKMTAGPARGPVRGTAEIAEGAGRHRADLHRALLSGLLSHFGLKDPQGGEYLGARGAKFALSPGSALFRRAPRWVVAAELVETTRLWARVAARVEPDWVEQLAEHLVKRSYSEPRWDRGRGAVLATERVTLYGVPLVTGRTVGYGKVDPVLARELFLRHALVEGDWDTRHTFFHRNRTLIDDVEDLEHRARRRDILVDDDTLFDFYDARVGTDVVSARHFDSWWKRTRRDRPDLLDFTPALLVSDGAAAVHEHDYPESWRQDDLTLPLEYRFEPGTEHDGVSVRIPLPVLNRVRADAFGWLVPGLRADLVTALIRSLPKALRRQFVPAPDTARTVLTELPEDIPGDGTAQVPPLTAIVGQILQRRTGTPVPHTAWDAEALPDHLRMTFIVEDENGREVGRGKDLDALRARLRPRMQESLSRAAREIERSRLDRWTLDALPRTVSLARDGQTVRGYPSLVADGEQVAVRVLDSAAEQERAMPAGTRRLVLAQLPSPVRAAAGRLDTRAKLVLADNPHGGVAALLADCLDAAADRLIAEAGGPAWDAPGFAALVEAVRPRLADALADLLTRTERVLAAAQDVRRALTATTSPTLRDGVADAREQLAALVYPGFVTATGWQRLPDLVRYLRALQYRLDRMPERAAADRAALAQLDDLADALDEARQALPPARRDDPRLAEIGWMLQELRVGLFAQQLRTAYPVSAKRVRKAIAALQD